MSKSRIICPYVYFWGYNYVCFKEQCAEPPFVNYSSLIGKKKTYHVDDILKYQCEDGYVLTGPGWPSCNQSIPIYNTIQCFVPGQWNISTSQLPNCVECKFASDFL